MNSLPGFDYAAGFETKYDSGGATVAHLHQNYLPNITIPIAHKAMHAIAEAYVIAAFQENDVAIGCYGNPANYPNIAGVE